MPSVASAVAAIPPNFDPRVHAAPPAFVAPTAEIPPVAAPAAAPALKVGSLIVTADGVACVLVVDNGQLQLGYFASVSAPVALEGLGYREL